jgi:hypothetical protein
MNQNTGNTVIGCKKSYIFCCKTQIGTGKYYLNQIASLKRKPSGKPSPLAIIGYGKDKESKNENLTVHFRLHPEVSFVAAEC